MRVATYTRISTDEDHQPYSLDAQDTRLRAYVASQPGWALARTFTDSISGAKLDRPGLSRALLEARAGRFDLLLVYRVDRLARSVRGLAQILEDLDAAGVAFRSATEPFDTASAAGRMMVQMLGVFAEFERATIIDRVIAGMERKAARGEWTLGGRPYGYTITRPQGQLVPKVGEAELVPIIFDLYVHRRLGAHGIAGWLTDRGHRSKTGRPWGHLAVLTILRNRVYLGEILFRGTHHQAGHPPLVDREVFEAAQQLLSARSNDHAKRATNASDYLLAGLIICDRCGKRYVGGSAHGARYRYRYYTCFSRARYGKTSCPAEVLPADALDTAVLDALLDTYADRDLFRRALAGAAGAGQRQRARQQAELTAVSDQLHKAEDALDRYLVAFEAGTLSDTQCAHRVDTLHRQSSDLRARQAALQAALDENRPATVTPADLKITYGQIRATITAGDTRPKKTVLQALVHEIRVHDRDKIQPTFRVSAPPRPDVRKLDGLVGPVRLELTLACS